MLQAEMALVRFDDILLSLKTQSDFLWQHKDSKIEIGLLKMEISVLPDHDFPTNGVPVVEWMSKATRFSARVVLPAQSVLVRSILQKLHKITGTRRSTFSHELIA
jgi:hypothetical protein